MSTKVIYVYTITNNACYNMITLFRWALFQKVLVRFLIDVKFLVLTAPCMEMSLQGYSVV